MLADHQYASRREADTLIEKGLVFINGKKAKLGDKVGDGDTVEVRGKQAEEKAYYAYHKPEGVVTVNAQKGEEEILDTINLPEKVYPVGRLDKETEGLIILTNDGRVATSLLKPDAETEKEYEVTLDKPVTHQLLMRLKHGVDIGAVGSVRHYKTKPVKIRKTAPKKIEMVLTEGKNRQIRRMAGAVGFKVVRLKRFRIGSLQLGNLKKGEYRKLKPAEVKAILKEV